MRAPRTRRATLCLNLARFHRELCVQRRRLTMKSWNIERISQVDTKETDWAKVRHSSPPTKNDGAPTIVELAEGGGGEFYNGKAQVTFLPPRINVIRGGTEPHSFLIKSTAPPLSREFIIAPIHPLPSRRESRPLFSRHETLMSNNSNFYAFLAVQ